MTTGLLEIVDFLGFIFILIAAFLISSKYVANPKVRMVTFISYFIACFFLIAWGWMASGNLITWFTLQQTVLIFINIRGITNARKDIKKFEGENKVLDGQVESLSQIKSLREPISTPSGKRDPFEVIVPKDFWEDILKGDCDNDY